MSERAITADGAELATRLRRAVAARADLFDERHEGTLRLFNGFFEGCPQLVADVYARTLVLHNYADDVAAGVPLLETAQTVMLAALPWLQCVVVKARSAASADERRGAVVWGGPPDRRVREHGVAYALDLLLNRDASLYLDTRLLRKWLIEHAAGMTVLNTFAYTGSLGVAALAGGARRVVQTDLNRTFLNVAKTSYTLNGFPISKADFLASDFYARVAQLKRSGSLFDCVIVDPPFFATTRFGTVDLQAESDRLINKVRPLIADGGYLVAINNALFVSGAAYMQQLDALCADGYLSIETLIPVPDDFIGLPATRVSEPPVDPAPFNHPTKIAVLRVRRKSTTP